MFGFQPRRHRWWFSNRGLGLVLIIAGLILLIRVIPFRAWIVLFAVGLCWGGWKLLTKW
jgi:hypothetical protein